MTKEEVPPQLLRGGALLIAPAFDLNITGDQRAVIQEAIDEWEGIIVATGAMANPYPIIFQNGPLSGNLLGLATTSWDAGGTLAGSTITTGPASGSSTRLREAIPSSTPMETASPRHA